MAWGDAVAGTRRLRPGGAESAALKGTEGLWGAEGPFGRTPSPGLVRELQRVRIAALHRKGARGGQPRGEGGTRQGGAGAAADPRRPRTAGDEPRQGARPAAV